MLSAAKHLSADRDRPFAALRVTRCDWSNGQGLFFKLNLALECHQTDSSYSLRNLNFSDTSANNSFIFAIVSSDTCDAGPTSRRTWNLRPRPRSEERRVGK